MAIVDVRIAAAMAGLVFSSLQAVEVKVNREETIVSGIPFFENGASPGWNNGSPMIVRQDDDVWFSLSRPVEGVPPYANTYWQIYKRQDEGWKTRCGLPV
jgi:hypothetical protein